MSEMTVREFLLEVRREARRLAPDFEGDLDAAYREAEHRVMMRRAEALEADYFEVRILDTIECLSPRDEAPVPTNRLVAELGMDYFALHYHLRKLEAKRLICRPRGERSGWKVA